MNILPLVIAFLIIFSYMTTTFLQEVNSFHLIERTMRGYQHTEKAIRNALVKKRYHKIKETPSLPKGKKIAEKPSQAFPSKRLGSPPLETSKFYLRALCASGIELTTHPLYEPLAELLRDLYKRPLFSKDLSLKNLEYRLIRALCDKALKHPDTDNFSDLYPDDPSLHELYYKMLKGTNYYTKDKGIAPLAHFLSLEKNPKGAFLSFASSPVLKALFGEDVATEIVNKEKSQWAETGKNTCFTKQDLETLLLKDPKKASLLSTLDPYLNYSKQQVARTSLAKRDSQTNIGIEKQL